MSLRRSRLVVSVVLAIGTLFLSNMVAVARGATAVISLVRVDAPPGVNWEGDKERQWFEIRLENWSPAQLAEWQVSIDAASFTTQNGGTMALAVEACCSDSRCEQLFGAGATCDIPNGAGEGVCTPAFQNANHYDGWAFDAPLAPIPAPYLTFAATADVVGPVMDAGGDYYGGTLVVDLSGDVAPFVIQILPAPDTFLVDAAGQPIPLLAVESPTTHVRYGRCCRISSTDCLPAVPRWQCTGPSDLWEPGITDCSFCFECVSSDACSDRNVCTRDECGLLPYGRCFRTPLYDVRTECCVPSTGQIFGGPDAKADPCRRIVCNVANQTYSFEQLPPGTPCDDGDSCTRQTICDAQGACVGQRACEYTCPKSRYLSFRLDDIHTAGCNEQRAVRVTFVDLPGFAQFNGETRWLSALAPYPEVFPGETFIGATLLCDPHFDNFGPADLIHVFGAGVIPGATYEVQTVDTSCTDLNDPACYSPPLLVQTGRWGDIVDLFWAPDGPAQPDFKDISGVVASFVASPGAPIKARAQLQPNVPDPNLDVDFKDIAAGVAAFVTSAYPYDGPNSCL